MLRKALPPAKPDYDSGGNAKAALFRGRAVDCIKSCQQIFRLRDAHRKMTMEGNVEAAAGGHHETVFSCFDTGRTRVQASTAEKDLRKRNHSPRAAERDARPEHIGVHGAVESRLKS